MSPARRISHAERRLPGGCAGAGLAAALAPEGRRERGGQAQGQVALITGAGSGIGAATATRFAQEGAAVALADLRGEPVRDRAAELAEGGATAVALAGDVARRADAEGLVKAVVKRFGGIDVLVNCAGVTPRYAPSEWDFEQTWDWVLNVTSRAPT